MKNKGPIFINNNISKTLISIIVPVFNEKDNILELTEKFRAVFDNTEVNYELIYIDDRSTDGTYELLNQIADKTHIFVYKKIGPQGKAYSLIEGFNYAKGNILGMIDGDLQYPVDSLPKMIELLKDHDIVIANRKEYRTSLLRKILSRGFKYVFANFLFGLRTDVQSGLKLFKHEVYDTVKYYPKSPWTFDLEFLVQSKEAGYKIKNYDIDFSCRINGYSKVNFIKQVIEIGINALYVRTRKYGPYYFTPEQNNNMLGAGIGYKGKRYITHTTLSHKITAINTLVFSQLIIIVTVSLLIIIGLILNTLYVMQLIIAVISVVYFIDVLFHFIVVVKSLKNECEISFSKIDLNNLNNNKLSTFPIYTILCPLYKEFAILPQFLKAIQNIDWPKSKLDVILLLEEDDVQTIETIKTIKLPKYVRSVVIPYSEPKTKPKACNYGLNLAESDYVVIYDAEDIPDPLQLKKAYLGFKKLPDEVACLQAKLNYYNPKQNLLTKFFTAEYSLWFDLTLPGFQSLNTSIPLGGTSNHFKTKVLKELKGWDTFNVTEDADLGIRLFKKGYRTSIIDSVTLEEANSDLKNWIRQRSRWIKGYMQSYLVHTRDFFNFQKDKGIHAWLFHLVIGTKLVFIFLNPLLWAATVGYFVFYKYVGPTIESLYLSPAFYLGVFSLVFGNFLHFYYYMIGCAKRKQWDLMFSILFIPLYWILLSIGGWVALYQLIFKPFYWEKTIHGLHLAKNKPEKVPDINEAIYFPKHRFEFPKISIINPVNIFINNNFRYLFSGTFLILSSSLASFLNLLTVFLLHRNILFVRSIKKEIKQSFKEFMFKKTSNNIADVPSILMFNWRDTKHVWAGGAEVYIFELAKRWVKQGNQVTIFCGNDRLNKNEEYIEDVRIIRKGGAYTVYIWAIIYYIFKFRGKFDVIIDSENGIPFFTPLFVRKPKFLLIHHIHQGVFRSYLRFPLSYIAIFLETKVMPFIYKNQKIITVSESSRKQIVSMGLSTYENISVINPGIDLLNYSVGAKTEHPSLLYLGRLKPYKNLDIIVYAFKKVLQKYPNAVLTFAGFGESMKNLQKLAKELGIDKQLRFLGYISDSDKIKLLSSSWIMLQPSLIEGWGITVIEANASGTPVIASRVNGLIDSVKDKKTGLLVDPYNVKNWSQQIIRLLSDNVLRNNLSIEANNWSKNFSWDNSSYMFQKIIFETVDIPTQTKEVFISSLFNRHEAI